MRLTTLSSSPRNSLRSLKTAESTPNQNGVTFARSGTAENSYLDIAYATKKGGHTLNEDRVVVLPYLVSASVLAESLNGEAEKASTTLGATDSEAGATTKLDLSKVTYLAVFDGHGGHECAEFLSHNLQDYIARMAISANCKTLEDIRFILSDAFKQADEDFVAKHTGNSSGACGAVALISGQEILVAHVGDCRVILRCNNTTIRLSRDHRPSNEDELQRVLANGGKVLNGRVGGVMTPTRSFGDVDVREHWGQGIIISEPEITYVTLDSSETNGQAVPSSHGMEEISTSPPPSPSALGNASPAFIMLATDGVFDDFTCDEACRIIDSYFKRNNHDLTRAVNRLVSEASNRTSDDCTAIVARWVSADIGSPKVLSKSFRQNSEENMPRY